MDIQPLLTLQEIDSHLRDLQKELKDSPKRRSEAKKRLEIASQTVDRAQAAVNAVKLSMSAYSDEMRRNRDRMDKMSRDQIALRSLKAFKASAVEQDNAEAAHAEAEAKHAEAMDQLSPEERNLRDAKEAFEQENVIVQEMLDGLADRRMAVEAELEHVQAQRDEAIKQVPEEALKYYERLKQTRWPCVVKFNLTSEVCTGCNLVQPPNVAQQVRRNQGMVTCPLCGRIFY